MFSQSGSQGSQGGPVLLDLLKYSYATVPLNSAGPVPWIHMSNDTSLVAYFETRRAQGSDGQIEERSIFKVLKDPEILEELDLQALAEEAHKAIERSKNALQHSSDNNTAVIVKTPAIAIKYPRNGREIRRFQIRFQSQEQYFQAMQLLARAGVPTIEAGTFPAQRPHTAASTTSSSTAVTDAQVSVTSRPVTAGTPPSAQSPRHQHVGASLMPPPARHSAANVDLRPVTSSYFQPQTPTPIVPMSAAQSLPRLNDENMTSSLYVPRPSTAPDKYSQHLGQQLPPRRELPFEKKKAAAREPLKELRNGKRFSVEPQSQPSKRFVGQQDVLENGLAQSQEASPTAKKQKRAPTKKATKPAITRAAASKATPKPAAPKKPRQTKKAVSRTRAPSPPVPSIEELLADEAEETQASQMREDTQSLLHRAMQTVSSSAPEAAEVPESSTASNFVMYQADDQYAALNQELGEHVAVTQDNATDDCRPDPMLMKQVTEPNLDAIPPHKSAGSAFPCIPAAQLTSASTPLAPLAQHHTSYLTDPVPAPLALSSSQQLPDVVVGTNTRSLPILADSVEKTHISLLHEPPLPDSAANTADWASQSKDVRSKAINRFICDAYQDPNFRKLCEEIEGNLGQMLLWPAKQVRDCYMEVPVDGVVRPEVGIGGDVAQDGPEGKTIAEGNEL